MDSEKTLVISAVSDEKAPKKSERAEAREMAARFGLEEECCRAILRKKKRYGLTIAQYDELATRQNGKCAICKEERHLVIDHSHGHGGVRGMLCNGCNMGLGGFRDNPESLIAAAEYLRKNARTVY